MSNDGGIVDLLVAGGGPAGMATAIQGALAGLSVTVVEPRATPIDKACGEGLMPGAVSALHRLGVDPVGHVFRGIRYVDRARSAEALFSIGTGLGVRRTVLQEAMAARATELGVRIERGRITDLRQHLDHVETDGRRARYVVAADGLHSPVRALLGLARAAGPRPAARAARYGIRRHVACPPWTDLVEVHWAASAEVYVTPIAADTVGIAVLGPRGTTLDTVLRELPELRGRIGAAAAIGPDRGAGPLRQDVARRVAGRVLLVGDAAGYVDALTGEGIRLAIDEAAAAVGCVVRGTPDGYEREWRTITARYRYATAALVALTARPLPRRALVPAAARFPMIFARCVDGLGGAGTPHAAGTARSDGSLTPPSATP